MKNTLIPVFLITISITMGQMDYQPIRGGLLDHFATGWEFSALSEQ